MVLTSRRNTYVKTGKLQNETTHLGKGSRTKIPNKRYYVSDTDSEDTEVGLGLGLCVNYIDYAYCFSQ